MLGERIVVPDATNLTSWFTFITSSFVKDNISDADKEKVIPETEVYVSVKSIPSLLKLKVFKSFEVPTTENSPFTMFAPAPVIPSILTKSPNLIRCESINETCMLVVLLPSISVFPVTVILLIPMTLSLAVEKKPSESTA